MAPLTEIDVALAAAGFGVYCFVHHRLNEYVQPLRIELAREGEMLLDEDRLPQSYKALIQHMLDNAFNPFFTIGMSVAIPIFIFAVVFRLFKIDLETIRDEGLRIRYQHVDYLFMRSVIAANPIGGLVMQVMLSFLTSFAVLAGHTRYIVNLPRTDVAEKLFEVIGCMPIRAPH